MIDRILHRIQILRRWYSLVVKFGGLEAFLELLHQWYIPPGNGWVHVAERLPTEDDADFSVFKLGVIEVWCPEEHKPRLYTLNTPWQEHLVIRNAYFRSDGKDRSQTRALRFHFWRPVPGATLGKQDEAQD